ncbi:hypothetical protein GGF50DRAFT_65516 [Schizophyllum commune]
MPHILDLDLAVLGLIQSWLSRRDLVILSSTCRALRALLRITIFASCRWIDDREPPKSIWSLIRELRVCSEAINGVHYSAFFRDLSNITSVCVCGETITDEIAFILASTPQLVCLDLSSLGRRSGDAVLAWETLPEFPMLCCQPRVIKFCSSHGPSYLKFSHQSICEKKSYATRWAFMTLLHEADISYVEELEVGTEALSIPCVATYTWNSLQRLTVTGFWLRPSDTLTNLANLHVHLGTLLISAPHLRVLRILCRFADWLAHPHCVAWPAEEARPPTGSAVPALEELDLRNPAPDEGLLIQLPRTLRALTLMTYPHLTNSLNPPQDWALAETAPLCGTRTPEEWISLLDAVALPELRTLRLSFRMLRDMALFQCIATRCPQLELLEVHGEIGPGCLWTAEQLYQFAEALIPLTNLRCLHVNTFNDVFAEELPPPLPSWLSYADLQSLSMPYGGNISEKDVVRAFAQLTSVSELWLPKSIPLVRRRARTQRYRRVWQAYRLLRDDGMVQIRAEPGIIECPKERSLELPANGEMTGGGFRGEPAMLGVTMNGDVYVLALGHASRKYLSSTRSRQLTHRPHLFQIEPWESEVVAERPSASRPNGCEPLGNALELVKALPFCERFDAIFRHLRISTDVDVLEKYESLVDLGQLNSLHVWAETISPNLDFLLYKANNVDTLDLAHLCCKSPLKFDYQGHSGTPTSYRLHYDALPEFHIITSRPRILRFCSRFDLVYGGAADVMMASKMRATRLPFVSLLAKIDVASVQHLEVGVEALSLPSVAPYTWTSLRELILTGYMVSSPDDCRAIEDPRLGVPARMFENVHLGTLLASAPRLAILRVRCRYAWWLARSRVVLWPSDELPPPSGSVLPVLEVFELRNPRADDGIFTQLPSSLRALALLTHPHTAHYMTPYNTSQPQGRDTLTPAELTHVLSLSRLPELRELRLSFRDLTDMRLFEYVARTFPRLQLLEFHSEAGEQRYWSAHEMIACARALSALRSLEVLRISTFGSALSNKKWEDLARCNSPEELAAFEWGPRAIPLFRIVSALFDSEEMTGGCLLERFPLLREVWLPDVISVGYRTVFHNQRVWRIYRVDRDQDGRRCLRLEPGPHVE